MKRLRIANLRSSLRRSNRGPDELTDEEVISTFAARHGVADAALRFALTTAETRSIVTGAATVDDVITRRTQESDLQRVLGIEPLTPVPPRNAPFA